MEINKCNNKKLRALIRVCWATLIIVWLVCFISGERLNVYIHNETLINIGNFIDSNLILRYGWSLVTYYFNMLFIVYAIFRKKLFSFKPIIISIFIFIIWIIKAIFNSYAFSSYLDFSYIILAIILDRKRWLRAVIEMVKALIFSFMCSFAKNYVGVQVIGLPSIILTIMMIDYYIIFIINYLYSIREENTNAKLGCILFKGKTLENRNSCFRNFISSCRSNYRSISSYLKSNAYTVYCAIIFFIITYGSIIIVSSLFDMVIEAAISMIAFHIFRHYDETTFHAKTSIKCWIISVISFTILLKLALPLRQSVFVSICLSYLLTKVMYYTQEFIDMKLRDKNVVILKPVEEYTVDELKSKFPDIEEAYIKAFYDYLHKDKYTTCERIVQKYHLSRATLYRVIDKIKKTI